MRRAPQGPARQVLHRFGESRNFPRVLKSQSTSEIEAKEHVCPFFEELEQNVKSEKHAAVGRYI